MTALTALLSLIVCLPVLSMSRNDGFKTMYEEGMELLSDEPYFGDTPSSKTVEVGQTAILHCSVHNRGELQISWRKSKDTEPLTVGEDTFYNNANYELEHPPRSTQWNLIIHKVTKEDSGMYECQVLSRLRNLRHQVLLIVKDKSPNTTSKPGPEINVRGKTHVEKGEQIYLVCNATRQEHLPDHIDWFFDGNTLSSKENKITIEQQVAISKRAIASFLTINNAQLSDSGNYVCRTSEKQISDMHVQVLNADTTNVKRGSIRDSTNGSEDGARQDKYSSGDSNSASVQHSHLCRSVQISLVVVLALARYWMYPS